MRHTIAIEVADLRLVIPDMFTPVDSGTDDPLRLSTYSAQTGQGVAILEARPIDASDAMPFGDGRRVVDGAHAELTDAQGLVEVGLGATNAGHDAIWKIIKAIEPDQTLGHHLTYNLTMDVRFDDTILELTVAAEEAGMTGVREKYVRDHAKRHHRIDKDGNGWAADPYDPTITSVVLRDLSDDIAWDARFPDHPLSMIRRTVLTVMNHD
ncbi:hypothetical protein BW13_00010 [Bifidobacterium sp. UTCIF-37]|uniref:hypothetical protein n=1 Tax=unclassified Bifidobacterium TaxID=2608897 RepID=UPI0011260BF6|nr:MULTISPECIES: hypothetical protein [unclassified Bifidobacterium]TPF87486.1 hypothetical protein BW13_00010 [Bifidobacterium sp. UTCIF-37]TPF91512.1 hypothetical protein BW11_00010 [Bifidobacterium sp. UTCIF-38]